MSTSTTPIQISRLPLETTKIVTAVLFGVAIITSLGRSYVQFYLLRQFKTEDYFHILSITFLIGLTTLYYVTMQTWYEALNLFTGGLAAFTPQNIQLAIKDFEPFPKQQSALTIMAVAVLFWIKFAYLAFFYRLISRMKKLYIYWWFIMVFTLVGWVVCLVSGAFGCPPWLGAAEVGKQCSGDQGGSTTRLYWIVVTAIIFDIVTDVFIASMPVALLWKTRLGLRQKLGLTILLSLSLVMVGVEIARLKTLYLNGRIDGVAAVFWQQQESAIAVTVFSLSSYRSFFSTTKKGKKKAAKKAAEKSPQKQKKPALFSRRSNQEGEMIVLPPIPSGTLTGLRSLFRGSGPASKIYTEDKEVVSPEMEEQSWRERQKQKRIAQGAFLEVTTVSDEFASSERTAVSDDPWRV